jgi:hypothetical protein
MSEQMSNEAKEFQQAMFAYLDGIVADTNKQFITTAPFSLEDNGKPVFSFSAFRDFSTSFFSKFLTFFKTKELTPVAIDKHVEQSTNMFLHGHTRADLSVYKAYRPQYLSGKQLPYVAVLNDLVKYALTIDAHLLEPFEKWSASFLSDPEYRQKIWSEVLVEKHHRDITGELAAFMNKGAGQDMALAPFLDSFFSLDEMKAVSKEITILNQGCYKLLDGKISKRVERISANIDAISKLRNIQDTMYEIPTAAMTAIGDYTISCAKVLEGVSLLCYHVYILSHCYDNTIKMIDKIKD